MTDKLDLAAIRQALRGARDPEQAAAEILEAMAEPWRMMGSAPQDEESIDILCDSAYSPFIERLVGCRWSPDDQDWVFNGDTLNVLKRKPLLWRRAMENKIRFR